MRNTLFPVVPANMVILVFLLAMGCTAGGGSSNAKSMEQLYSEEGRPVRVRQLEPEDFSVYLKYPTVLDAQSESTAYAALSDVVRNIAVRVGDQVKQDQVVLSFSENNAGYQQARLNYENAETAYNRSKSLFSASDISQQDFDNSRMRYEMAKANLDAARDMVYVKAPIAGTLIHLNVRVTENVNPGTPLFTISNQNGLVTRFYVGENEINRIKNGARVYIDGVQDYYAEEMWSFPMEALAGRVTQVSLLIDSKKHAFPVTAFFDITGLMASVQARPFISGVSIDVAVETYRNESALVVSRKELLRTGTGYAAFVARSGNGDGPFAEKVDVQIGHERGLDFEISGGLKAGDVLITDGITELFDGGRINIINPAKGVTQ